MYHLLYSVLIAMANNVDNISVRVAYSIRGIRLDNIKNLWISAITFVISVFFALTGSMAAGAVGGIVCKIAGAAILCFMGLIFILEPKLKKHSEMKNRKKKSSMLSILANPEESDMDDSKCIDFKEATLLGVSLSVNNAGGCLSAGMMGLNAMVIGVLSALISFLSLWAGNYLALFFIKHNFGRKASVAAGIILIATGLKQMFP